MVVNGVESGACWGDKLLNKDHGLGTITVRKRVGKANVMVRKYFFLQGLSPVGNTYRVYNNSYGNVCHALLERVFYVKNPLFGVNIAYDTLAGTGLPMDIIDMINAYCERPLSLPQPEFIQPPQPNRVYFRRMMSKFTRKLFAELDITPVSRMSLQQFVETSPVHKRKIYEQARMTYLRQGINRRDASVTSFVKGEKVKKMPRIIQPRGVVFNLIFGCFIRPAEKVVYRAIDRVFGRPTVVSGQNAQGIATMLRSAWDEIVDPVAVPFDLSRMDQHVSETCLDWEHSIYRHQYKHDNCFGTLNWCLSKTIVNDGQIYTSDRNGTRYRIKYVKRGSRMSGDMNTSLGNKSIMCGLLYSYFTGRHGLVPRVDYNLVDNGDDCVVIMSREAFTRWKGTGDSISNWFLSMGFTLTEEPIVDVFTDIRFCQSAPVLLDGVWTMVRGLDALKKDCICMKPRAELAAWLGSMRQGGLAVYGNCPIYSAFYDAFPDDARASRAILKNQSAFYYLARGLTGGRREVSDQNRFNFWCTFGVTPTEQRAIEDYYDKMSFIGDPSRADTTPAEYILTGPCLPISSGEI